MVYFILFLMQTGGHNQELYLFLTATKAIIFFIRIYCDKLNDYEKPAKNLETGDGCRSVWLSIPEISINFAYVFQFL